MKLKTRILIVVPNDNLGGAEQLLKMIAHHFDNELVEVIFLTRKNTNQWEVLNQKVKLSYSNHNSLYIGALSFVLSFLFKRKKERFRYIFTSHVFTTGLVGLLIWISLIKKDYFIGRESTHIFKRFRGFKLMLYKLMYKFGYPSLDLLICQTVDMKQDLLKSMPSLKEATNIVVIPNPINLQEIYNKSTISNPTKYGDYIISAGRLIPEKGYDLLINAFYKIKQDYKSFKLVILGDGEEKIILSNQISELGLEGEVFLPGFVDNVYPYFKFAKLCVVSSRVEGFPNVLLQMMSQNDKVVSTKCAGGIEDIKGVFIAETDNINSLETAIKLCFEADTSANEYIFQENLKDRSIDNFILKIEKELSL